MMTATIPVVHQQRVTIDRKQAVAGIFVMLGLVDIFVFGFLADKGDAVFTFTLNGAAVSVPNLSLPPGPVSEGLGALSIVLGVLYAGLKLRELSRRLVRPRDARVHRVLLVLVRRRPDPAPVRIADANHHAGLDPPGSRCALGLSVRTVGCHQHRHRGPAAPRGLRRSCHSSAFGSIWLGLVTGSLAGGLLGVLLAVFAIRYLVDQIILGVVLNVFASGLTGYLYDQALVPYENRLNSPPTFNSIKIPVLGDIPIIGPILFDSTIFLYITYAAVALVHIGLFKTRWGLVSGLSVEHPTAADTVGIRVLFTRYRNVILGRSARRDRRCLPHHRIGRVVRQGHLLRTGIYRPGGNDLRPLDPARCDRCRPVLRLLGRLANVLGTIGAPSPPTSS